MVSTSGTRAGQSFGSPAKERIGDDAISAIDCAVVLQWYCAHLQHNHNTGDDGIALDDNTGIADGIVVDSNIAGDDGIAVNHNTGDDGIAVDERAACTQRPCSGIVIVPQLIARRPALRAGPSCLAGFCGVGPPRDGPLSDRLAPVHSGRGFWTGACRPVENAPVKRVSRSETSAPGSIATPTRRGCVAAVSVIAVCKA